MIRDLLLGKSPQERAVIKGQEISKLEHRGIFVSPEYGVKVEIQSLNEIPGGVEIYARAWKNGKQLGFGKDGTVEIEHFRIINPPILVDDPNGDIIQESVDDVTKAIRVRKLREDPIEAIRQSLAHTIKTVGKENSPIIRGKVGNTTSTFYSAEGGDGELRQNSDTNWATQRNSTSATTLNTADLSCGVQTYPSYKMIKRDGITFLTGTTIATGSTISSAVLSLYSTGTSDDGALASSLGVTTSTQTDPVSIAAADYDNCVLNSPTEFITRILFTDITASAYLDRTLNADGRANIGMGTGVYSYFFLRSSHDIDNTDPGDPGAGKYSQTAFSNSSFAGTTQDPKLVVVHTGAGVGGTAARLTLLGVGL